MSDIDVPVDFSSGATELVPCWVCKKCLYPYKPEYYRPESCDGFGCSEQTHKEEAVLLVHIPRFMYDRLKEMHSKINKVMHNHKHFVKVMREFMAMVTTDTLFILE